MRKLILLYFTLLGLGITQAQTVLPIKSKTYTFGLLKNYYQDVNKIALNPGFQLTLEKDKWLIIHQLLPGQLYRLPFYNSCDFIGHFFRRDYYQFATNYYLFKNNNLLISSGFNIRILYGDKLLACLDKGTWREIISEERLAFEPGLNTNLLYFPFSGKNVSKIGFSANINMMAYGSNTYQVGICYKHISKKPIKKQ